MSWGRGCEGTTRGLRGYYEGRESRQKRCAGRGHGKGQREKGRLEGDWDKCQGVSLTTSAKDSDG